MQAKIRSLDRTERQTNRTLRQILFALVFAGLIGFFIRIYVVQEFLVMISVLALLTAAIFLFVVAIFLFYSGLRKLALWSKPRLARLATSG
jgi:uncharacterized membrane protein